MSYRTVNVRPETHARLTAYKMGGATFDDVLVALMDATPEAAIHQRLRRTSDPVQERIRQSAGAKQPVRPGFVRFDETRR